MKEAIAEKGFQSLEVIVTPYQAEEIRLTQEYHMTEAESDNYMVATSYILGTLGETSFLIN